MTHTQTRQIGTPRIHVERTPHIGGWRAVCHHCGWLGRSSDERADAVRSVQIHQAWHRVRGQ